MNVHGEDFKVDCKACHKTDGWNVNISEMAFNHNETSFALEGQHTKTDCRSCHETLVFEEAENSCASCHSDVHNMSVGNDCIRCHSTDNWLVDHIPELHEQNGFLLVGAHQMASCIDCHKSQTNLIWERIGNDCASCHMDDYNSSTDPNHAASGFSTQCDDCHEPISMSWGGGNFHFFFDLTQGHNINECSACHIGNDYSSASPVCSSCHMDDFNNTTNPNHSGIGFSTDCASCHTTAPGWRPVHSDFHNFFPLNQGHDVQDCNACHDPNDYSSASPECVTCHQNDYDNANNPNHSSQGFSTNCALCHSTRPGWSPAQMGNHDADYFPIYSGKHDNEWATCADCHYDPNDYQVYTCLDCHGSQSDLAEDHEDEPDYQYLSTACYFCHPTGEE